MTITVNPRSGPLPRRLRAPELGVSPRALHRRLPGYAPSTLVPLPDVAASVGVREVLAKVEANRFGLPAFKVLGASWAIWRLVCRRLGRSDDPSEIGSFDDLRRVAAPLGHLTLVTATDGNHGRAVAATARWFGFDAHIVVPAGTADARTAAIRSEGAEVTVLDADYDACVRHAAALADDRHLVVSDTSWSGYRDIPADIAAGYATLFEELDEQCLELGVGPISGVVIPMGVGALAMAAVWHWPDGATRRIAVEPSDADCLARSIAAGSPVTVPGPHRSMMVGMNCGTVSELAWPVLDAGIDACVTVDDADAATAMVALARAGVVVGETGAASVAALLAAARSNEIGSLGLGDVSSVVCLCTEGATDPRNYEAIVGTPSSALSAPGS